jgi:TatD DNase family protein
MDQASSFQAIRLGFFVGIAGPITYLNAKTLRSIASQLPLARLIIETDAPYLTPHPHRGTRNEPAYVRFVAEKLADLFQSEYDTIAKVTYKNASNLFRWDYEDTEDDPV